jgi:uncharacterized alpha/beta hydrolase family protein
VEIKKPSRKEKKILQQLAEEMNVEWFNLVGGW